MPLSDRRPRTPLAALGLLLAACGGAAPVPAPAPTGPAPSPAAAAPADPNAGFTGVRARAADVTTLTRDPVLVEECGAVLVLERVEWVTSEGADGETRRDATAVVRATRGEEERRVRIPEGATRSAFTCTIAVASADTPYDEGVLDYLPVAAVTIRSAP